MNQIDFLTIVTKNKILSHFFSVSFTKSQFDILDQKTSNISIMPRKNSKFGLESTREINVEQKCFELNCQGLIESQLRFNFKLFSHYVCLNNFQSLLNIL